jgi:hypothetical protein
MAAFICAGVSIERIVRRARDDAGAHLGAGAGAAGAALATARARSDSVVGRCNIMAVFSPKLLSAPAARRDDRANRAHRAGARFRTPVELPTS